MSTLHNCLFVVHCAGDFSGATVPSSKPFSFQTEKTSNRTANRIATARYVIWNALPWCGLGDVPRGKEHGMTGWLIKEKSSESKGGRDASWGQPK